MFGKQKYVYTCPDHIHDRAVAKKNAKISLMLNLGFLGGLIGWSVVAQKLEDRKKPGLSIVPDPAS